MTFRLGQRVRIMPHSDIFMMGETHGTIEGIGRLWLRVKGQRSGRVFKFSIRTDALEAA